MQTAGRFAVVKEDFHHITVEEDFDATHIGDAAIEIDVVHDCSLRDQSGHAVATLPASRSIELPLAGLVPVAMSIVKSSSSARCMSV